MAVSLHTRALTISENAFGPKHARVAAPSKLAPGNLACSQSLASYSRRPLSTPAATGLGRAPWHSNRSPGTRRRRCLTT